MDKQIKKVLLTAIGAACIAREKAETIAKEVVNQGLISKNEAKKLVGSFLHKAEMESRKLHSLLKSQVGKATKAAHQRGSAAVKRAVAKANKQGKKILRKLSR